MSHDEKDCVNCATPEKDRSAEDQETIEDVLCGAASEPRDRTDKATAKEPRDIECPHCKAPPLHTCKDFLGRYLMSGYHQDRYDAARTLRTSEATNWDVAPNCAKPAGHGCKSIDANICAQCLYWNHGATVTGEPRSETATEREMWAVVADDDGLVMHASDRKANLESDIENMNDPRSGYRVKFRLEGPYVLRRPTATASPDDAPTGFDPCPFCKERHEHPWKIVHDVAMGALLMPGNSMACRIAEVRALALEVERQRAAVAILKAENEDLRRESDPPPDMEPLRAALHQALLQLGGLVMAAKRRVEVGCQDTCSARLVADGTYPCDCGHEALRAALGPSHSSSDGSEGGNAP